MKKQDDVSHPKIFKRWAPTSDKWSYNPSDPFTRPFIGIVSPFITTWNAKCPIFLGNFTPKTSNYCLKNRAIGFPGPSFWYLTSVNFLPPVLSVGLTGDSPFEAMDSLEKLDLARCRGAGPKAINSLVGLLVVPRQQPSERTLTVFHTFPGSRWLFQKDNFCWEPKNWRFTLTITSK